MISSRLLLKPKFNYQNQYGREVSLGLESKYECVEDSIIQ